MKTILRVAVIFLGFILFLMLISGVGGYFYLKMTLPPVSGSVDVTGIDAPIEIFYDGMGIPQIFAMNETDAYFALGWVHASDRLFQMELSRRAALGRLAEMFGTVALHADIQSRRVGHVRRAERALNELDEMTRRIHEAYASGINAYIEQARLPFEFIVLRQSVEPWSVLDVLAIHSFQEHYSGELSDYNNYMYHVLYKRLGEDKTKSLLNKASAQAPVDAAVLIKPDEQTIESIIQSLKIAHASNAWAIAPERSASGTPMLASDPHMPPNMLPGLWYIAGIHIDGSDFGVTGITFPGLPAFVMGHTRHTAWGMTASPIDTWDLYREKINPENRNEYLTPDGWEQFTIFDDVINIKNNDEPYITRIYKSRNGVAVELDTLNNEALVWRWPGFDFSPANQARGALGMPHARSWDEFTNLMTDGIVGAFNWIFTNSDGEIGYIAGNTIPVRNYDKTYYPLEGWRDEYRWAGYRSQNELPQIYNPSAGWVANTNNRPETGNFDYRLEGLGFSEPRMQRIKKLFPQYDTFSFNDMIDFQLDLIDVSKFNIRDEAINVLSGFDETRIVVTAIDSLQNWNGYSGKDSYSSALLHVWYATMNDMMFRDKLGGPIRGVFFDAIFQNIDSEWYLNITHPEINGRDDLMRIAMEKTLDATKGKSWQDFIYIETEHPLSRVPVLSRLLKLKRGPFPTEGSGGTLRASFHRMHRDGTFRVTSNASWRRVVDLGSVDEALMVLPFGQSGNPMSPHYFNFFDLWKNGEYWNVPLSRERIEERAVTVFMLRCDCDMFTRR